MPKHSNQLVVPSRSLVIFGGTLDGSPVEILNDDEGSTKIIYKAYWKRIYFSVKIIEMG